MIVNLLFYFVLWCYFFEDTWCVELNDIANILTISCRRSCRIDVGHLEYAIVNISAVCDLQSCKAKSDEAYLVEISVLSSTCISQL